MNSEKDLNIKIPEGDFTGIANKHIETVPCSINPKKITNGFEANPRSIIKLIIVDIHDALKKMGKDKFPLQEAPDTADEENTMMNDVNPELDDDEWNKIYYERIQNSDIPQRKQEIREINQKNRTERIQWTYRQFLGTLQKMSEGDYPDFLPKNDNFNTSYMIEGKETSISDYIKSVLNGILKDIETSKD